MINIVIVISWSSPPISKIFKVILFFFFLNYLQWKWTVRQCQKPTDDGDSSSGEWRNFGYFLRRKPNFLGFKNNFGWTPRKPYLTTSSPFYSQYPNCPGIFWKTINFKIFDDVDDVQARYWSKKSKSQNSERGGNFDFGFRWRARHLPVSFFAKLPTLHDSCRIFVLKILFKQINGDRWDSKPTSGPSS